MSGSSPRRLYAKVSGRVQGVGFRASTVAVGRRLGLGGWVRNLYSGEVELEAEGPLDALDKLLVFLHRGPRGARVDGVAIEYDPPSTSGPSPLPVPFEMLPTA